MNSIKVIKLSEYGKSIGTRELGREVREKTICTIRDSDKVLFDFSDMVIISSAFADELFGKLFIELGEDSFKNDIKVNKFDNDDAKSLIISIINRAINFRKDNPNL